MTKYKVIIILLMIGRLSLSCGLVPRPKTGNQSTQVREHHTNSRELFLQE